MPDSQDELELSPGVAAILDLWLRHRSTAAPAATRLSTAELVGYLSGTLPSPVSAAVERALAADADARRQLVAVAGHLEALQQRGLGEEGTPAPDPLAAEVGHAWRELVSQQSRALSDTPLTWLRRGWEGVRAGIDAGAPDALAAWSAFLLFGERLRASLTTPTWAASREAAALPFVTAVTATGSEVLLAVRDAEIEPDGTLHVELTRTAGGDDTAGEPSDLFAVLLLHANGESWPVASGVLRGSQLSWSLPGVGAALQLPQGPLPTSALGVILGPTSAELPATPSTPWTLLVQVPERSPVAGPAPAQPLVVSDVRRTEGGLEFILELPPPVRKTYAECLLILELPVGSGWQRLGEWRVRDWESNSRQLVLAVPGDWPQAVPLAAVLRARLQPEDHAA